MLKLQILAVGEKMPTWVKQGFDDYAKRIRGRFSLKLVEIPAIRRTANADLVRIARDEEKKIRQYCSTSQRTIALDRVGKRLSTLAIANKMDLWLQDGENINLVIGGPEGLSQAFLQDCDDIWSLSDLTMAHPVARLVLAEQLYRCCSVLDGQPYHR